MTIRAPSFLSRSRPSSPVPTRPDQVSPNDGDTPNSVLPTRRPLSRLQNPFKRATSASPAPAARSPFVNGLTPLEPASSLPGGGAQYLDSLGLRFAEAASKALANPVGPIVADAVPTAPTPVVSNDPCAQMLKGRKPFPPGRGATLGSLITSELGRTGDIHLSRAIVRTLQRPLSVMLNNLSTMLMPILPYVTSSGENASTAPTSFLAQAHALGIARLAAELLEALNGINAGAFQGVGGVDPLRGIRDGLEVLVQRVVSPLIGNVKVELGPILDMLATPPSADGESSTPSALPSLTAALPGITTRLEWYTSPPGSVSQSAHAALLIALVWRALAALASRPLPDPFVSMLPASMKKPSSREGMKEGAGKERTTPPGLKAKKELPFVTALSHISSSRSTTTSHTPSNSTSTLSGSTLLNGVPTSGGVAAVAAAASVGATATPPRTPPVTPRFGRIGLPTISRPPSPNSSAAPSSKPKGPSAPLGLSPLQRLLADTTAVQALLNGLSKPPKGGLAFEAVDEAFEALEGFKGLLSWLVEESNGVDSAAKSLPQMVEALVEKSEDVPALIALGVLLQLIPPSQLPRSSTPDSSQLFSAMTLPEWRALSVSELVHIPSTEYRTNCLAGFGRADAAVEPVGRAVLDAIAARRPPSPPRSTSSSSTSTFLTVSASVPPSVAPALLSTERGLDVRVLRAWLAERIITNDDDKEPSAVVPSLTLNDDSGLREVRENLPATMDLNADVPAVGAVIGGGGGQTTRLA